MEGYGRWIALILFLVWFGFAFYQDYKRDKWSVILPTLYLIGASIIVAILMFIIVCW